MKVVFQKKFTIWFKSCPEILSGFALLYFIHLYKDPSSLTPRYEAGLPFALLFISYIFLVGIISFYRWVCRPKLLTVDFDKQLIHEGSRVHHFNNNEIVINTHSYSNNRFFRLSFYDISKVKKYKVPEGFGADITYQELMDKLDEMLIPFSIVHEPWLFKQKQKISDAKRTSRAISKI